MTFVVCVVLVVVLAVVVAAVVVIVAFVLTVQSVSPPGVAVTSALLIGIISIAAFRIILAAFVVAVVALVAAGAGAAVAGSRDGSPAGFVPSSPPPSRSASCISIVLYPHNMQL